MALGGSDVTVGATEQSDRQKRPQDGDGRVYLVEDEHGEERIVPTRSRAAELASGSTTDLTASASSVQVALVVSAPGQVREGPLPADETATIWVGAVEDSGDAPVAVTNEPLEVTVSRPDGIDDTFSVTTDSNGGASVSYDLSQSGRDDGTYYVTVTAPNYSGASATKTVHVGPHLIVTSGWGETVFTGETATFAVLVHDGETGVSGTAVQLDVRDPDGNSVKSTTKTTDSNGFVEIPFTPSQTGNYSVQAELNGRFKSTNVTAADRLAVSNYTLQRALVGATNVLGGHLTTAAGPLGNKTLQVKLFTDYQQRNLLLEGSTTTDAGGMYTFEYDLPATHDGGNLYAEIVADGSVVPQTRDFVSVSDPTADGGGATSSVMIDSSTAYRHAPGETETVQITATDDGTPITGTAVDVVLRYDYGGPPFYATTVTTDSNGEASFSVTLPQDAPAGYGIDGTAALTYDGSTHTGRIYSNIQRYAYNFDVPTLIPGATETFSIDVAEVATGNAASDIPLLFDAQYQSIRAGTFGYDGLVSGGNGTDDASITVPPDVGFEGILNPIYRRGAIRGGRPVTPDHPGTLSTNDTLVAGQDATFEFTTSNNPTLHCLAFGRTSHPTGRTFATRFQGPGTFTIELPSDLSTGDWVPFTVWGVDDTGTIYMDEQNLTIDDQDISVYANCETGVPVGGSATLSVIANDVETVTVDKVWTDWSLASQTPDGASVTDTISSAGTVDLDWGSIRASTESSLTLSLPSDYVGGAYLLDVTATNSNGESAETTGLLTIE